MVPRESFEKIKFLKIIFYSLLSIYILYLLYDLIRGDSGRYVWTIFAIALVLLPLAFEKYSGIYFPWDIKIIVVLSLLLHTMGEFHRWYYTLTHYDKISHIISSIGIAYLIFIFLIFIELYYGLKWKSNQAVFFIFIITISFALYWEWWELFSDHYYGSKFFWNMQDGIGDAIANSAGAIVAAWDANQYLKRRSEEDIAKDFIIQDENRRPKIRWGILPIENEKVTKEGKKRISHRGAKGGPIASLED
jgi:hypothetical protein